MKMTDGHCAALSIDAERGAYACTVYARRPETCRTLARGSGECRGELATKKDRPIEALNRLKRRRGDRAV
jgi:Fe-S-cluster containining protein